MKAANESGGYGMLMGPKATKAEIEKFRETNHRRPAQLHRAAADFSLAASDVLSTDGWKAGTWICARSSCPVNAFRSFPAASRASRCARVRLSSIRRRAAAARTPGCFMEMNELKRIANVRSLRSFMECVRCVSDSTFESNSKFKNVKPRRPLALLDGPLHRARRKHRAHRGRQSATAARLAQPRRGTACANTGCRSSRAPATTGFFQAAQPARDRPGGHRISRLPAGESQFDCLSPSARRAKMPAWCATRSRSNCGRN